MTEKSLWKKFRENLKWLDPFTYVDLYVMPKINPKENKTIKLIVYVVFAAIFAWLFIFIFGLILGTRVPFAIVMSGSMEPLLYRGDILIIHGVNIEQINAPLVEFNGNLSGKLFHEYATAYCMLDSGEEVKCSSLNFFVLKPEQINTTKLEFASGQFLEIQKTGDIIVYNSTLGIPVFHRVIAKVHANDGIFLLTKGDSPQNPLIDQQAGITAFPITQKEIVGRSFMIGSAPFKIPILGYVKILPFDDLPNFLKSLLNH